jgi:hypothetical protein
MKWEELLTRFQGGRSKYGLWIAVVAVAAFLAYYWDMTDRHSGASGEPKESVQEAATFIPDGFVLVPIEVANYESLDSILGKFGVVDLYKADEDPKKRPFKVAERIKILRAPLNPSHFAVLATEADSGKIVSQAGPFIVVVQHPSKSGTNFVNTHSDDSKSHQRNRSRIEVEVSRAEEN